MNESTGDTKCSVSRDVEASNQRQSAVTPGSGLSTDADPAVSCAAQVALQRIQRRKSLKANRSMNPIDILSSFFNEPIQGKRNRVPTREFLMNKENYAFSIKFTHFRYIVRIWGTTKT